MEHPDGDNHGVGGLVVVGVDGGDVGVVGKVVPVAPTVRGQELNDLRVAEKSSGEKKRKKQSYFDASCTEFRRKLVDVQTVALHRT